MRSRTLSRTMAVLIGSMIFAAGCGGEVPKPTGTLTGKVTFDGAPVASANVQVQSDTGAAAAGKTDQDGNYKIESVKVGKYIATVTPADEAPPAGATPEPPKPKERTDIPEKYRAPDKSGLALTVDKGPNTFDVKMTK